MSRLGRWWRNLWRRSAAPAAADPPPARRSSGSATIDSADAPQTRPRRHYTAPPADDDPQRETRLGAVLQALGGGTLSRAELAARVGAADWGQGRLDAVVAHGVAAGILLETDGGAVQARYAD